MAGTLAPRFSNLIARVLRSADPSKAEEVKTVLKHWEAAADCQRQIGEAREIGDLLWEKELEDAREDHLKKARNLAPSLTA